MDTAPWYGNGSRSEHLLGKILADVPRKAYFISTKTCIYGFESKTVKDTRNYESTKAAQSVLESLERLKLDYVDLLYVSFMVG